MHIMKNIAQKAIRIFLQPRRRRRFSRVNLILLLILVALEIAGLIAPSRIFTPDAAAQSQIQNLHTSSRSGAWLAIPVADTLGPRSNLPPGPQSYASSCAGSSIWGNPPPPATQTANRPVTPVVANNFLFIFTNPSLTLCTAAVPAIWRWSLMVVNAFIVLVLMLQGIKIMLSGTVFRYASFIESLPGAICAIVAANASLVFIAAILSLNNILAIGLYNMSTDNGWGNTNNSTLTDTECNQWYTAGGAIFGAGAGGVVGGGPVGAIVGGLLGGWVGDMIGCHLFPNHQNVNQSVQSNLQGGVPSLTGLNAIFQTFTNLLGFLTGMLILVLIGQMVLRIFFIDLYAIMAPIAIACWALPGRVGQPVTQMWFKGFISTVMAQFVQVAGLIIAETLTGTIINYMSTIPGLNQALTHDSTMRFVIALTQLWFIIRIPALFETAPTRALIDVGQNLVVAGQTAVMMQLMEAQMLVQAVFGAGGVGAGIGGAGDAAAAAAA